MTEYNLILMEKILDGSASSAEKAEFEQIIIREPEMKKEFEEQKHIKEVLKMVQLKNPTNEVWDGYWESIYNRLERSIAWLFIFAGAAILLAIGSYEAVENFFADTQTPAVIKYSTAAVVFGLALLLFSVIREKLFTRKNDKYKEIQR